MVIPNRTERSPIRSVITQMSNKIGRLHSGSPISVVVKHQYDNRLDGIGRHLVLLPKLIITIKKFVILKGFSKLKYNIPPTVVREYFAKKSKISIQVSMQAMVYTVHAWRILTYYPVLLMLKSWQLIRFGNVVIVMINADTWVMLREQIKIAQIC